MITKTNQGFEGSIKSPQATPDGRLGSAYADHIIGPAWLIFSIRMKTYACLVHSHLMAAALFGSEDCL